MRLIYPRPATVTLRLSAPAVSYFTAVCVLLFLPELAFQGQFLLGTFKV